jgi:myo-inositol-1(or 4)-monophosphatase
LGCSALWAQSQEGEALNRISSIADLVPEIEKAGQMALEAQRHVRTLDRSLKADGSILTQTDQRVEAFLTAQIKHRFPETNVLGEESVWSFDRQRPYTFCIDPIDGTNVYSQGMAGWCVSVGLLDETLTPVAGVIVAPRLGLVFAADVGDVGTLNGVEMCLPDKPLPLSPRANLMVPSRLHHHLDVRQFPGNLRSLGSTALQLVYPLAYEGVFATIQTPGSYVWDIAGAHALCRSVGACFEYLDGRVVEYEPLLAGETCPETILVGPRAQVDELKGIVRKLGKDVTDVG